MSFIISVGSIYTEFQRTKRVIYYFGILLFYNESAQRANFQLINKDEHLGVGSLSWTIFNFIKTQIFSAISSNLKIQYFDTEKYR